MSETTQLATFAGGCFWGMEHHFNHIKGVLAAPCGYMGGDLDDPTYREICSGTTNHAEVIQITFDPSVISYKELLAEFWRIHDPTTLNRQGVDVGTQYRSAIFFHSEEQEREAKESAAEFQPRFSRPIVTQIVPTETFWRAEPYHQRYFEANNVATSCHRPNW
jgi:peptide-methionine (S)-S-oxide reductase